MDMQAQGNYVTEIARLFPEQGHWRERDYFALPETNLIVELSEGKLIMLPAPTPVHQIIIGNLHAALRDYLNANPIGQVLLAPIDVRLWADKIRQPDILLIRTEHSNRITDRYIDGAPDWVAEVISEATRQADEVEKLVEYAQAGIPEYWLIDPESHSVRVYTLAGEGVYTLMSTITAGQTATSTKLSGFAIAVDTVFPLS
jgi:Uma2 family endonuclease